MTPDAAVATAATWVAGLAAASLVFPACGRVLARRPPLGRALFVGLVLAVTGGGVALAAPHGRHALRPTGVSADWPGAGHGPRGSAVVVAPGDCLWDIAERRLRRPTARDIAAAWPQWWQRNRRVIGTDPDVIHPGQRLRPPVFRSST